MDDLINNSHERVHFCQRHPNAEFFGFHIIAYKHDIIPTGQQYYWEHVQAHFNLLLVLDGVALCQYRHKQFSVEKGFVLLTPPNSWRVYHSDPQKPFEHFRIVLDGAPLREAQTKLPLHPIKIPHFKEVAEALTDINDDRQSEDSHILRVSVQSLKLLSEFLSHSITKRHPESDIVDKLILRIRKHPARSMDFHQWASRNGVSYSLLRKRMKELTGFPPQHFLNHERMKLACSFLHQGMPVKEAAFKVGFPDPYYFSRLFKKHMGSAPNRFMKNLSM